MIWVWAQQIIWHWHKNMFLYISNIIIVFSTACEYSTAKSNTGWIPSLPLPLHFHPHISPAEDHTNDIIVWPRDVYMKLSAVSYKTMCPKLLNTKIFMAFHRPSTASADQPPQPHQAWMYPWDPSIDYARPQASPTQTVLRLRGLNPRIARFSKWFQRSWVLFKKVAKAAALLVVV